MSGGSPGAGARSRRSMERALARGRRRLSRLRAWARERSLVTGQDVVLILHAGRWTWAREHPRASREQLRDRHLKRVVDAVRAAGVDGFVVADPTGARHQVGVRDERWAQALTAVADALRGEAWYAESGGSRWLVDRLPADHDDAVNLYPCYRVAGTQVATGTELGVVLVPWRRRDGDYLPARRNAQAGALGRDDLDVVEVERHGRRWPVPRALETPHVDEVGPLRWVVHVPAALRREAPGLADLLGRGAARSVWFHGLGAGSLTLLDDVRPSWCTGPGAPEVVVRDGAGDETADLVSLWAEAPGPLAVLPAGGLLLRDLVANALSSPGGVTTFDVDADEIDARPDALMTPRLWEGRRVQAWFEGRTGIRMRWLVSHAPYALPPLDERGRRDLERLLSDPDRPRTGTGGTAALLPVWWAYRRGASLPGTLTVAHLTPGGRRYARTLARLSGGEGRAVAVSVDPTGLGDTPAALAPLEDLLRHRLPVAAPWEAEAAT